jgi:rare lipoprotein A
LSRNTTIQQISKVAETSVEVILDLPRTVISAEEKLRRRLQALLRVALATSFIWLSGILSIGVQATAAIGKTATKEKTPRERRIRQHYKGLRQDAPAAKMEGTASWYGKRFHNRKTASGKTFDKNAFMAAHRSLPFGTMLKVTNLNNNKTCIVEVTDRGPFVHNRIIDLSQAAAKALEFTSNGTTQVRLEVLSPEFAALYKAQPRFLSDALTAPSLAIGSSMSVK